MAETKHTPGPWVVKRSGAMVWVESPVHTVCRLYADSHSSGMDAEPNARLIAAAPAMHEALIEALGMILLLSPSDREVGQTALVAKIKAALSVAKVGGVDAEA